MFTRRNFLTTSSLLVGASALGGAALGGRLTRAAGPNPCRVVIFIEGNGTRPECLYDPLTRQNLEDIAGKPITGNGTYAHDDPVLTLAAPLAEARALSSLAAGPGELSLVERAATVFGLSATYVNGNHTSGFGALSASKASGGPGGPTIETVLSQVAGVRGTTPFDVVRVGVGDSTTPLNYGTCAFATNKPAPILLSPTASFTSLFGSVAAGQAGKDFNARKRLLEFGVEDVERELKGLGGSTRGRDKIETYRASMLEMLARNDQLAGMKDAIVAAKPVEPGTMVPDPYASTDFLKRLTLQVDVATAALLAGLTNVVVVSLGSGHVWNNRYPELLDFYPDKEIVDGHDLRHVSSPAANELLYELTSRGVGEMARMARALAARPESGGTMLDNTVLLYLSDNGERHHSKAEEWAMLLLGGNNMGFKTDGRSVTYPGSGHPNNRQTSNMFNSLLHGVGAPTDDFGHNDPKTRIAPGPLAEIWA